MRKSSKLNVQTLEAREMPAHFTVTSMQMASISVDAGQEDVRLGMATITPHIGAGVFTGVDFNNPVNPGKLSNVEVWVDDRDARKRLRPDGNPDYKIGTSEIVNGKITLDVDDTRLNKAKRVIFIGDIDPNAESGKVGLGKPTVEIMRGRREVNPRQIRYRGYNPVHTVKESLALSITIGDDHKSQYSPGVRDAVFATLEFDLRGSDLMFADDLFVAVNAREAGGFWMSDAVEDIDLRNMKTGFTIQGELRKEGYSPINSTGFYGFPDVALRDGDKWEIRLSLRPAYGPGTVFDLRVSTDTAGGSGTTFGGLIDGPDPEFTLRVEDIDGRPVTNIPTGEVLFGRDQVIEHTQLSFSELNIGELEYVVPGQKNVTVFAAAMYNVGQDTLLTGLNFLTETGDALNWKNFRGWGDLDGDGRVETIIHDGVSPSGGLITLNNFYGGGFVLTDGQKMRFELHADVALSVTENRTARFGLNLDAANGAVQAELLDTGNSVSTDILGLKGKTLEIVSGSVQVKQLALGIPGRLILGGTQSETLMGIELTARNEAQNITEFKVILSGQHRSLHGLPLMKMGETTKFGEMSLIETLANGDKVYRVSLTRRQLIVPKDQSVAFYILGNAKTDLDGGVDGDQFKLVMPAGFNAVTAIGETSSMQTPGTVATAFVSASHQIVMSKVTSVINVSSAPDYTQIPMGWAEGGTWQFNTAMSGNDLNGKDRVGFEAMTFKVKMTQGVDMGHEFRIMNLNDMSTSIAASSVVDAEGDPITGPYTGEMFVTFWVSGYSAFQINAGESARFRVMANFLNAGLDDSVEMSLLTGQTWWSSSDAAHKITRVGLGLLDQEIRSVRYHS